MTYFTNVNTLDELRSQYKTLLKRFHPDQPDGSGDATKAINAEYERLFKRIKENHTSAEKTAQNAKYDATEDALLREMLNKIINLAGINIEIIGQWLWLSGNTYQYRKELKELGFKFAGQKKMWYWHSEAFRKKSRKKLSINDIRNYYGSTAVATEAKLLYAM